MRISSEFQFRLLPLRLWAWACDASAQRRPGRASRCHRYRFAQSRRTGSNPLLLRILGSKLAPPILSPHDLLRGGGVYCMKEKQPIMLCRSEEYLEKRSSHSLQSRRLFGCRLQGEDLGFSPAAWQMPSWCWFHQKPPPPPCPSLPPSTLSHRARNAWCCQRAAPGTR